MASLPTWTMDLVRWAPGLGFCTHSGRWKAYRDPCQVEELNQLNQPQPGLGIKLWLGLVCGHLGAEMGALSVLFKAEYPRLS